MVVAAAIDVGLEHRRLPWLEILDVSDAGIGFPGLLLGLVQVAEIADCRHSFDGVIRRGHHPIGELLELGRDRRLVDEDRLLPLV
jgi:hypothetical protein